MNIKDRNAALDYLKGLAVIFMVIQHLSLWLWDRGWSASREVFREAPLFNIVIGFSALSAPVFIFASGCGAFIFMRRYRDNFKIVRRGFVLITLGYFMVSTIDVWFSPFSWYVLQCIGLCMLTVPLIRKMDNRQRAIAACIIALVSASGQYLLQTPLVYGNVRMSDSSLFMAPLRFALFEGHFPFFPWCAVFIYGYICGSFVEKKDYKSLALISGIIILAGLFFASAGIIFPVLRETGVLKYVFSYRIRFYPLLFPVLFLLSGAASLSLCLLYFLCSRFNITGKNPVAATGRFSLTIFFTHLYIKELAYKLGFFQIFSKWQTIAVIVMLLVLYAVISIFWEKKNYRFSLEWALRKLG